MVMGPTHAMSGAAGGLALAQVLPLSSGAITPPELLIYAGITAGAALLPDLDSPQSTIARSFGPASLGLSRLVEHASQALVNKTRGPRDSTCYNGHRTATHTIWFGILTGLLATLLISIFHDYATIALLCIFLTLALRGLVPLWTQQHSWLAIMTVAAALTGAAWYTLSPETSTLMMGSAVTVGVFIHLAGDFITKAGIPALAPLVAIDQRRWHSFRLPTAWRIPASGPADQILLITFTLIFAAQIYFYIIIPLQQ